MMLKLSAKAIMAAALVASIPAAAQSVSVTQQREAVAAWTQCIADENADEVHDLLVLDYRSNEYRRLIDDLADRRVSSECFNAMPRRYRRIELGGLPFAGGLAERMLEAGDGEPLVMRLSMAAIGTPAETYSYTDQVANCVARGAPNLVADLFATPVASDAETAVFTQIDPVLDICTQDGSSINASPLAMRSMLATASYRMLAAQTEEMNENDDA